MSYLLWKLYIENDVESFVQLLDEASIASRSTAAPRMLKSEHNNINVGSPGSISGSSASKTKTKHNARSVDTTEVSVQGKFVGFTLTRADINCRNSKGLTLLHSAASSTNENAKSFALSLVKHPLIDLHAQDKENGWTALHRAFYFGNITIARAILERESKDAIGTGGVAVQAASLFKAKDLEGNGPYDLLTATIGERTLSSSNSSPSNSDVDMEDVGAIDEESSSDEEDDSALGGMMYPSASLNLEADEFFTFGSNKNSTLGLGSSDNRQFPERVSFTRPGHLFSRFYRERNEQRSNELAILGNYYAANLGKKLTEPDEAYDENPSSLPATIMSTPIFIRDVQMAKFHTAVLTDDPVSNLYICGHGIGGRLGVGDEETRFQLVCVENFGSLPRKIFEVALGQDHTLAVGSMGELFSWGSNHYGQLGLGLSKTSINAQEPPQLVPKQIFGILKREIVAGVAASRIHSVVHTSNALYTFGKNEGQLGIMDAHAGSLKIQSTPRRVLASRITCRIVSVCATDRATAYLLENREVHVLANYGVVKLQFPLDKVANPLSETSQRATRYDSSAPRITKVTCAGDTICALSNAGEIFAVTVDQRLDPGESSGTSTTNPTKIREALSTPQRVWSLKKGHMSATDVAVDQDGSIIISTEAGNVWRRVRRVTGAKSRLSGQTDKRSKEFKISRVPGLTRVIAVRASSSGAYGALRKECDVTKTQIEVENKTLWNDFANLLPFKNIAEFKKSDTKILEGPYWTPQRPELLDILVGLSNSRDLEQDIANVLRNKPNQQCYKFDTVVTTTESDVEIPAHWFLLSSRSKYLAGTLELVNKTDQFDGDLIKLERSQTGQLVLTIKGVEFQTVVEFLLYVYTDYHIASWLHGNRNVDVVTHAGQVRRELLRLSIRFNIPVLEAALRRQEQPRDVILCLDKDLDIALANPGFFGDANASIHLKDTEVAVHIDMISMRCPFFKGLFQGRASGRWLDERTQTIEGSDQLVGVDLSHIDGKVFRLVLRHIYTDIGEELFDGVVTDDLDTFLDLVLDVLSASNELMLDRLSQVCQKVLGRYVNTRNVCSLLNAVGPSSVTEFKRSALEFLCLNLEGMLSNNLLDDLEDDLLHELDITVRANQLNFSPISKSGRAERKLHENNPELAEAIAKEQKAQLEKMRLETKHPNSHASLLGNSVDQDSDDVFRSPRRSVNSQAMSMDLQMLPKESKEQNGSSGKGPQYASFDGAFDLSSLTLNSEDVVLAEKEENHEQPAWRNLPLSSTKLGMKEIMDQASSSRMSNLSLGFASQAKDEERLKGSFHPKLSQKERRRQQRQVSDAPGPSTLAGDPSTSPAPQSPWQTVAPKPKSTALKAPIPRIKDSSAESTASSSTRQPTTPQLTMRQTVANSAPATGMKSPQAAQSPQTPKMKNDSNIAQGSLPKSSHTNQMSSPISKPIEIQSIRHSPRTQADISPTFLMHQSLADIFSQQEAEKSTVKEAVAKRSLQEIQQEQEFQEWWDQESKRVMEEETTAARAAAASRNKKDTGSRGGRSRGRRGKGKEATGPS